MTTTTRQMAVTKAIRGGMVLADPRTGYPKIYVNRKQASDAADRWGGYVIPPAPFGRGFRVGVTLPTAEEVASCN